MLNLNRLISAGLYHELNTTQAHTIKLINIFCLVGISVTLISMLVTISQVHLSQISFAVMIIFAFRLIIQLNFKGLYRIAFHSFMGLGLLGITLACLFNNYETYIFLYFIPISLIAMMTSEYYRLRYVYFAISTGLILFISVYYQCFQFKPWVTQSWDFIQQQQYTSLVLSNLCIFYLLILFRKASREYEQRIAKDHFYTHDLLIKSQHVNQELQQSQQELRLKAKNLEETNRKLEATQKHLKNTLKNLKNAQAQLVQSEKMVSLGQLTAGIAHELNNPINFIYSGTKALEISMTDVSEVLSEYEAITPENVTQQLVKIDELKEEIEFLEVREELPSMLENIKNGANRTAEIVRGLQTFSRLDENDIKAVDLHQNIDSTLVILRNQYKERIQIDRCYGDLPPVECLPGKINQVFMNVLANAVQAIENEGTITIETTFAAPITIAKTEVPTIKIMIQDTGIGIPSEVQHKIFDPFFTTKDVGEGTGLGLSITHGIVKKHHGKIEVQTELGKGTKFVIYLPVYQVDAKSVLMS